jgi:hypothetical protein
MIKLTIVSTLKHITNQEHAPTRKKFTFPPAKAEKYDRIIWTLNDHFYHLEDVTFFSSPTLSLFNLQFSQQPK